MGSYSLRSEAGRALQQLPLWMKCDEANAKLEVSSALRQNVGSVQRMAPSSPKRPSGITA